MGGKRTGWPGCDVGLSAPQPLALARFVSAWSCDGPERSQHCAGAAWPTCWVTGRSCPVDMWKPSLESPVRASWLRCGRPATRKCNAAACGRGAATREGACPQCPQLLALPQPPRSRRARPGLRAQGEQRDGGRGPQGSQQVERPEAPADGGHQWPPQQMWHQVAVALSARALLGDGGAADGSLATIQKVLQAGSSCLLSELARTAAAGGL